MSQIATARTAWDDASSPASARLARRFEHAWRAAGPARKPSARQFLAGDVNIEPGALLALLRAEIGLRWDAGDPLAPEEYQLAYPELTEEDYVALVYEDFCMREELRGSASVDDYLTRFSAVGSRLKRVLDIHELVGSGAGTSSTSYGSLGLDGATPKPAFPEASQTIAGFHLVEELGRGSFARVFLAKERNLADRPVALKVARTGSREPQTLAKLQHTHIVPVHSYQTDDLTSLHLLCMPYFGRVTLAHLLADPQSRLACSGHDLLEILDRLDPGAARHAGPSTGRASIAKRPHARAIAWWGARMAEALQHAHDRGVLHRDVKPSNVLITSDGMPMLLDFNLASEITFEETSKLGGTLDYMAPEHLEALAEGVDDGVEARSDLYSLGVLLHEALVGRRPFAPPTGVLSMSAALYQAAEVRREAKIQLRATNPEVPAAFDAVIAHCLAANPADRYETAAELAADLQAIADDMPLQVAREPIADRLISWGRRHRSRLMMATPIAAALIVALASAVNVKNVRHEQQTINGEQTRSWIRSANIDQDQYRPELALGEFTSAERLARGNTQLIAEWRQAKDGIAKAGETIKIRNAADAIFAATASLRFGLLDGDGDRAAASTRLDQLLEPFHVAHHPNWTSRVELNLLDKTRWPRLRDEVDQLLFQRLVGGKDPRTWASSHQAIDICMRAERWSANPAPWQVLKAWLGGADVTLPLDLNRPDSITAEPSATTSLQWGLLLWGKQQIQPAIAWIRHASDLDRENAFYHFVLGVICDDAGLADEALLQSHLAFALDSHSLYARFNRARMLAETPQWWTAQHDLAQVIHSGNDPNLVRSARLIRGLTAQKLGDIALARSDYDEILKQGTKDRTGLSALLNRAKLDDDSGDSASALGAYNLILAERSDDAEALLGRALMGLRRGRYQQAEQDLTSLVNLGGPSSRHAEASAHRAVARLALGKIAAAVADADRAFQFSATPSHERIKLRCRLAAGKVEAGRLADPEELSRLPWGAEPLKHDLLQEAERLRSAAARSDPAAAVACESRAVVLAVLGDPQALAQVDRAVALAPGSGRARLIRARILRYRGMAEAAAMTVSGGLILEPDNAELLALRGRLRTEFGDPALGLDDAERAIRLGSAVTGHLARAESLMALRDYPRAASAWGEVIREDPSFIEAHIGLAACTLKLGDLGRARSALTSALAMSSGRLNLLCKIGWMTTKTWKLDVSQNRELAQQ